MTVGEHGSEELSGPTPAAAERRLGVLGAYEVLDTDAEADFDDIAVIAAQLASTPMAAVSLVDAERQW